MDARAIPIPTRPGPVPTCSDAEILTIAVVRHLLGRPSERAFLAEGHADGSASFPHVPHQSEFNRRVRWLWGAFEALRQQIMGARIADGWQQVDTTALPVKHPSRVRGPDSGDGPGELHAGFGWDGAHHEWFDGFRLALRTELSSRLVRAWSLVPAAVKERTVADAWLDNAAATGLLLDRGFTGRAWHDQKQAEGIPVVLTPGRTERRQPPVALRRPIAALRNRIETTKGELTERLGLARHGAKTFWGLLTRSAATILAHTLILSKLV